jgi:hypothetical protein
MRLIPRHLSELVLATALGLAVAKGQAVLGNQVDAAQKAEAERHSKTALLALENHDLRVAADELAIAKRLDPTNALVWFNSAVVLADLSPTLANKDLKRAEELGLPAVQLKEVSALRSRIDYALAKLRRSIVGTWVAHDVDVDNRDYETDFQWTFRFDAGNVVGAFTFTRSAPSSYSSFSRNCDPRGDAIRQVWRGGLEVDFLAEDGDIHIYTRAIQCQNDCGCGIGGAIREYVVKSRSDLEMRVLDRALRAEPIYVFRKQ